ncbi:hypothetical protein FACS1894186_6730 [Alphaproteobacteria bacterium]|nr:hypothetical protein FACS1894186_6730 [Alphaproteobacteria bacterium]
MRKNLVAAAVLAIGACAAPESFTEDPLAPYKGDDSVLYRSDSTKDGYRVVVDYSTYEMMPRIGEAEDKCKEMLAKIVGEELVSRGHTDADVARRSTRVSMGRDNVLLQTRCTAAATVILTK